MLKRQFLVAATGCALSCASPFAFAADAYPAKDLKMVIPFAPGGATDIVFRLFATTAEKTLGQPIVPVNMGGAGGSRGSTFVKRAPADGYTLLGGHEFLMTTYHAGMVQFGLEAFEPVCTLTRTPAFITVGAQTPYKTFADFVKTAKEQPGKIVLAMTPASVQQVFWTQFCKAYGLDLNKSFRVVMINGAGPQTKALVGGHTDVALGDIPSKEAYIKDGRLRVLAITDANRLPQLPDVPTLKEIGTLVTHAVTRAIFLPKGSPKQAVETIAAAFAKAAKDPAVIKRVEELGNQIVFYGPEETGKYFYGADPAYKAALAKPKAE